MTHIYLIDLLHNAERKGSLEVVALWIIFAKQNHKGAAYKLSSTRSVRFWRDLLEQRWFELLETTFLQRLTKATD